MFASHTLSLSLPLTYHTMSLSSINELCKFKVAQFFFSSSHTLRRGVHRRLHLGSICGSSFNAFLFPCRFYIVWHLSFLYGYTQCHCIVFFSLFVECATSLAHRAEQTNMHALGIGINSRDVIFFSPFLFFIATLFSHSFVLHDMKCDKRERSIDTKIVAASMNK